MKSKQKISELDFENKIYKHALNKFQNPRIHHQHRWNIWKQLNHGKALIKTKEQLNAYIALYSKVHYYRYQLAYDIFFDKFSTDFDDSDIIVFDWGCGIGIGTYLLLQNGQKHRSFYKNLNSRILIDNSSFILNQAAYILNNNIPSNSVYDYDKINKSKCIWDLSEVYNRDLNWSIANTKKKKSFIHIFGNILDIKKVNKNSIFNTINNSLKGNNYFLCVSPSSIAGAEEEIQELLELFQNKYDNLKPIYNDYKSTYGTYYMLKYNAETSSNIRAYISIYKIRIK